MQFLLDNGSAAENSGLSQRPVSPRDLDNKKVNTSSNSGTGESGALRPRTPLTATIDGGSGVKTQSPEASSIAVSFSQERATLRAAGDSPIDDDSFHIHSKGVRPNSNLSRIECSLEEYHISHEGEGIEFAVGGEDIDTETETVEEGSVALNDSDARDEGNTTSIIDEGTPQEESEEARITRELAESEALAWQIMQQEADNAYHMQMEYMHNNRDQMSQEDYEALNQIVRESALPAAAAPPTSGAEEEELENGGAHEDGDSIDSNAAWEDPNNYDRLLALGNHIGDVKTERWRERSRAVIQGLPR